MGGATKPSVTRVQGTSQATPLANDILKMLMAQINSGQAGTGFGPLQRDAGTAIQQFVNSGGGQFDTTQMFKDMESGHQRRVDQGAGQIREGYSMIGGRMGTGSRGDEADFRANANAEYGARIGEINRQEFGNQQNRLLQAIGAMFNMGTENMAPFFNFASQGIMPETITVGDSPLSAGSGLLAGLAQMFQTGKGIYDSINNRGGIPTMGPNTGTTTNNPLGGDETPMGRIGRNGYQFAPVNIGRGGIPSKYGY